MLADQDVRMSTSIGEGHHELPSMPERNDDMHPLVIEVIHRFGTLCPDPDGPTEEPDQRGPDRREHVQLEPIHHKDNAEE
jgi:hypothetical protein